MYKWSLLLLVSLSLLVSIDAITALAARSAIKLPASGGDYDKRSLRGFMSDDETTTEERAALGGVEKLKGLLSSNKISEKIAAIKKAHLDQREEFVKKLIAKGVDYDTLMAKKVTIKEMVKALDITEKDIKYGNPYLLSDNYRNAKGYRRHVEIFGKKLGLD